MFPPRPPTGVFQSHTVGDRILLPGHTPPRLPDVFFAPFVGEVINLTLGQSGKRRIVGDGRGRGDFDEESGEIAGEGCRDRHGGGGVGDRQISRAEDIQRERGGKK